jgi:Cu-processing system permease protein
MLITGCIISVIFVAIAFLSTILTQDKAKGIGISIMLWLYFAILFDGFVLFLSFQFADYPIEKPMIFMSTLNPIDLARILILLRLDISVMMGYTGAVFKEFFGTSSGLLATFVILLFWIAVPFFISLARFKHKDL